MPAIYLLIQGLFAKSDSIGGDLAFQYRLFKRWGLPVRVFAEYYSHNLYPDIPIEHIDRLETAIKEKPSLIIYHWGDGWGKVDELLSDSSLPVIVKWYNNTPPWFFAPYHTESTMRTTRGFKSIVKIAEAKNIKFWVDSEFTARQAEILGISTNRIDIVYPASPNIEFGHEKIRRKQVSEKPIKGNNIRLLFVGRIVPNKGYRHMIIVAYVLQKWLGRKVELHFPGRPDMPNYLQNIKKLASDLGVSLYFYGEVELSELNRLYKTSDAYLSLSEHEGFGLPVIEAMQMGLPVVGYKTTAVAELLKDHPLACNDLNYFEIAKKVAAAVLKNNIRTAVLNWQYKVIAPRFSRKVIENQIVKALNKNNIIKKAGNDNIEFSSNMNALSKINKMVENAIFEIEKYNPMPKMSLPFADKDYHNHYMTAYDISAYDNLLLNQKANLEEISLFDEAMQVNFSSPRPMLGPWIIKLKKLILLLQDGVIKTIAKVDTRLNKKISQLDEKISLLDKRIEMSIGAKSIKQKKKKSEDKKIIGNHIH